MVHDPLDPANVRTCDAFFPLRSALVADVRAAVEAEKQAPGSPYGPDADGWENVTIEAFLEAALRWAEDTRMDENQGLPSTELGGRRGLARLTTAASIRCRVAACPAPPSGAWDFYLINDSEAPLDSAVLRRVAYEWGGQGRTDAVNVQIGRLAPGAHAHIWRDDGNGVEGRMDLTLEIGMRSHHASLLFEFPILYKKTTLPQVSELGKPGWEERAVA